MVRRYQELVLTLAFLLLNLDALAQLSVYTRADSIAEVYAGHSLKDLEILSHKLTGSLTSDEEKFRAIYKWVCTNIEGDYALAEDNLAKRRQLTGQALDAWNREFSVKAMRILLNDYRTVCTGYAWLVRELARYAGIPCEIINGYGRTSKSKIGERDIPNHSWNAVQLDNKWYLCDPTWSSGAVNTMTGIFIPNFEERYYLADPKLFVRNHFPLDTAWTLLQDPPSFDEFLNAPLLSRATRIVK